MSKITEHDIRLIRLLQLDIPLTPEPFTAIGQKVGMTGSEVLEQIGQWKEEGVVRRYGAAVRHYKMGFVSNGMSVWNVPEDRIEEVGEIFVSFDEVSHCYIRERIPGFVYNLYAMIHGRVKEDVTGAAKAMSEKSGIEEYDILWSEREFKRDSMFYFVEND